MKENTLADISLSGYKDFDSLISDIKEASKNIPTNYSYLAADIYAVYKEDNDDENIIRELVTLEVSNIDEAINELKKLGKSACTKIILDVSLEKSHNDPKEYHTCIYCSGIPQTP